MTLILRNVDLTVSPPNSIDAWETCAASGYNIVIFTGNRSHGSPGTVAAYSIDYGDTFIEIDTSQICAPFGQTPCCDQVVIFIPKIDLFMWVMQTYEGNYVCSLASPTEISSSSGRLWHSFLLKATHLGGDITDTLDFPEIAVGDNYLYMTCTLFNKGMLGIRFRLADLSAMHKSGKSLSGEYFLCSGWSSLRPAQNTDSKGYLVGQRNDSELVVIPWPEPVAGILIAMQMFPVSISTIPTKDWEVKLPDGVAPGWLSVGSKISAIITGLTYSYGKLWVAWTGARNFSDGTPVFPYPHIGLAIIDTSTFMLDSQHHIFHKDFAFAWPSLATNSEGDVGMSYSVGGNGSYPQCGVALLTDSNGHFSPRDMKTITSDIARESGGHYTIIRQNFPNTEWFCASNWNKTTDPQGIWVNHPYYITWLVDWYR